MEQKRMGLARILESAMLVLGCVMCGFHLYASWVGTFTVDEGLVEAVEPVTEGDFSIDGVPGTAANTPGTIVNELAAHSCKTIAIPHLRIGHPWGVMDVCADLRPNADGTYSVLSGNLDRTARRIMEGYVYIRN